MTLTATVPSKLAYMTLEEPQRFTPGPPWGWHLVLNLYDCQPEAIRSHGVIEKYVIDLCALIEMRRFGDPVIVKFGDDPAVTGYSMFQLIETSNLCAHFAEHSNAAYIDIFSCKVFDPQAAADFSRQTFGANTATGVFISRE